jgi:glycosyltransferase involved in cell wall biosynthesis
LQKVQLVKISGFTIIKNAVINDYPIVEAITSILPIVDEMIVLAGDSDDNTVELVQSINNPKIKIHHSVWNKSLRSGGSALADETNKAFKLIDPLADWAFYIQADEVVHEKYLDAIVEGCKKYKDTPKVQGLVFKYTHFYGTYDYVGDSRRWYNNEVRVIRNDKSISSYKDAQGFRVGRTKLLVKQIDAFIYHYGWVKNPEQMKKKQKHVSQYWTSEEEHQQVLASPDFFDFNDFDSIDRFQGTHPQVMRDRIARLNWKLDLDTNQKKFSVKDRLLYWFEKATGIRLFDFRNYRILP